MNNRNFDEDLANQIYSKKFKQGKKSKKVITIFRKLFKICCIILIIIGIFKLFGKLGQFNRMYNSDMLDEMNGKYNEKFEIVSSDVNEIGSGTYLLSPKNNKNIQFNASKKGSYIKDDYRDSIIKYYTEKYVKEHQINNIKISESKINDPLYHKIDFLQYDFWFEIQSYNDIENVVTTLFNIESYICENALSKNMFTLGGKIRKNGYISNVQYNGYSQLDSLLYQEQYSYINYLKENNISTQDISNDEIQRIWKPEKLKIIVNNKEIENSDTRKLMDNSFATFNLELKDYDLYLPHLVEYIESIEKTENNMIKYKGKTYKIEGNTYTDKNISYQCSITKLQEIFNAEIHYDYTSKKIFINIE